MNRVNYFRRAATLFACSVVLVTQSPAAAAATTKPNILLILADDQRWDTIHALGNPDIQTPNLDRLVERGFRFNNAYCMGSMIGAVCTPSRTMLITGRSLWCIPQNPGAQTAPPGVPVLPTLLKEAGYVTFHCGKAGNTCTFANAAFDIHLPTKGRTALSATEHGNKTVEFLENHDGRKPFFIYLAPPVPHDPRLAPEAFVQLYDPTKLKLSKNFMPDHPFDNGELRIRDEELAPHPRTPEAMRQHLADYYATISHLDHEVGRILDTLKKRGWSDNTIIIFSSDQGLAAGGRHGLMGKQNLYEHVKPPLIFAGPGIRRGHSDALVYLYDLFPTICDFSGAKTPGVVEGKSLLPIIKSKKSKVRDWLFAAYKDCQRMIRDDRWKLIKYNASGVRNVQLFDLKNDPDELHNLATVPKHAKQRAYLEKLLIDARKQFGDPVDFDGSRQGNEAATTSTASENASPEPPFTSRPNIVYILCDDLGYGDVKCLNPNGQIATPNIDRLASQGMVFTDAHSSSSVCSPTRYGIMTGRYNWRSRLKSGVLGGMSPRLIEPGRLTVPALLKQHGYHTAVIGKWHLGMDWALKSDAKPFDDTIEKGEDGWRVDFTKPIHNGPNSVGFDYYYGISASLDMVPYTFIEDDHVVKLPTEDKAFPQMFGRPGGTTRKGPGAVDFEARDVLPALARKAVEYIEQRANVAKRGHPFFLYLPLNAPHTPIAPTPEWQNKSGLNPYADFVMEVDAEVGKVITALQKNGLAQNTLVIFTSDNGCSPQAGFPELLGKGHNPSCEFRGTKADIFDGGHRVPFVARWPGKIRAGSSSDQLICLTDLLATCADILGNRLPQDAGEDSVSILPALLGKAKEPLREAVVHHSVNGSFAIRDRRWKLELCSDSGGWSAPKPGSAEAKQLPPVQLYDLNSDLGEKINVQNKHPEIVARLTTLLETYVADGRSTPGAPQPNSGEVSIWRERPGAAQSRN